MAAGTGGGHCGGGWQGEGPGPGRERGRRTAFAGGGHWRGDRGLAVERGAHRRRLGASGTLVMVRGGPGVAIAPVMPEGAVMP